MRYLAEDTRLHRTVALKVLREVEGDSGLHFLREAYAAARLQHPGIASVLEAGAGTGVVWIAMQYVPGLSLRQTLTERGSLAPREGATIAAGIAEALHAAHAQGLVHRDVKPANVVLGPSGPPHRNTSPRHVWRRPAADAAKTHCQCRRVNGWRAGTKPAASGSSD